MLKLLALRSAASSVFDVLVVGGGHAGCEAAAASARVGASTLLLTHRLDTIGDMACNPSFGGIGKGQLVREVDALDGLCGRLCDESGIMFRMLNRSRGPAVWGPRAQVDRKLYKQHMQRELLTETPNLVVETGNVENLLIDEETADDGRCVPVVRGVLLANGQTIHARSVVIATGTFLRGEVFVGLERRPAGRLGEDASYGLSDTLERLGFRLARLRTGTPPRIDAASVDYSALTAQLGDQRPVPFSFLNEKVRIAPEDQVECHVTFTNQKTVDLCREHVHLNEHIRGESTGPRYCPSLEAKVLRFANVRHQVFIEPEGLDSDLKYPAGISMTFPPDVQLKVMQTIAGLEKVRMVRAGYGVQYDYVDPRQLHRSLETKPVAKLFLAGQINGTTGYEEAAAQGLIAGANAALRVRRAEPLLVGRADSYIGVLIDDLTTDGTNEPYRMFTTRAEFRLHLRPDNADLRLTEMGRRHGVVSDRRYLAFTKSRDEYDAALQTLTVDKRPLVKWRDLLPDHSLSSGPHVKSALEMIGAHRVKLDDLCDRFPERFGHLRTLSRSVCERLTCEARYASYVAAMADKMDEVQRQASIRLPDAYDYGQLDTMSSECRERLNAAQPETLGAASRIPGVTPAALVSLLHLARRSPAAAAATAA